MEGMKIYISGKITGFEGYKEKFAEAERYLRLIGNIPLNPAVLPEGLSYDEYLYLDFAMIDICDAVYFLENWEDSPGAMKEFQYAATNGKRLFYQE